MISSVNPTTGTVIHTAQAATADEVAESVGRAQAAQLSWASTPLDERIALLHRFGDLVRRDGDLLADLIVAEMGKLRAEAVGEVEWTVLSAHWYAEHPPRTEQVAGATVRPTPLGVLAVITPWNVPLHTPAWKWLPALLAGNTVVWKPSELTPAVAVHAAGLLAEAGLPAGVLELVLGAGDTGRALVNDPRIGGVHFTGSTDTGRAIAQAVAGRLVPCALELGGLNPVLVFADADIEHAADCIIAAGVSINGQKCTATRRVIVHEAAADELTATLADRVKALVGGDPADPATALGPLVTAAAAGKARSLVAAAVQTGARVVAESPRVVTGGDAGDTFFPATLLADLDPADRLRSHELFAPVIAVESVSDDDAAWRLANASDYGLSAAVHTRDPERAAQAPARLRAGVINVNRRGDAVDLEAPFGGMKSSGNGLSEGGEYVYASLTRLQAAYGGWPRQR
ncbi:MAG: aldehyde dehydrogenase [Nocardioidaceae bacterium]|nr:aldehyde dehydrogenase [Nocardioidaceae bacterium]